MVTIDQWIFPGKIPIEEWRGGLRLGRPSRILRGKRGKPLKR
jgi:hypothetical protein